MNISEISRETYKTLSSLKERTGGSLFYRTSEDPYNRVASTTSTPSDSKPFTISIFNTYYNSDIVKLVLFINPKDFTVGQTHVFNNTYTRRGWINVAWGNQQATIAASGISSGFYFYSDKKYGLTNYRRTSTAGYINVIDIAGIFKNNGWYFMDGVTNPSLFRDGTSRVINVMDSVKIEYDGSIYIGSFSSFTLNDVASNPYRLEYNFDFVISSFGTDLQGVDGHISRDGNESKNDVTVALQGHNINFDPIIGLDKEEINNYYPPSSIPDPTEYDYGNKEQREEINYWTDENGNPLPVVDVPEGTFRVTRGWRDTEDHEGKCDFRTGSGNIYALVQGRVHSVRRSNVRGGSNYVITKSEFRGKDIYVRYYHLSTRSIILNEGDFVYLGDIVGREGTDNGAYPPHCDFEVREIQGLNNTYRQSTRIDCTPLMDWSVNLLKDKNLDDFQSIVFKHGEKKSV